MRKISEESTILKVYWKWTNRISDESTRV